MNNRITLLFHFFHNSREPSSPIFIVAHTAALKTPTYDLKAKIRDHRLRSLTGRSSGLLKMCPKSFRG